MDDLQYTYSDAGGNYTNQVQSINDQATDASTNGYKAGVHGYQYDNNGNMTNDASKGLGVSYNFLNLPQTNTIAGGIITYVYDAKGKKLRRINTIGSGSQTDYVDKIQYDNGHLNFIQTEEGIAVYNGTNYTFNYQYNLSDHLGNSRLSYDTQAGTADTVQRDNYLPFGLDVSISVVNQQNYYLYNNKELQPILGIYDYDNRFYDPVIGKFTTIDPKAEEGKRWSPYGYCYDDPLGKVDMDGMIPWPLRGYFIVNKSKTISGYGLKNTIVRTSTWLATDRPKGTSNPHMGIDYRAEIGTPFYSLGNGVVTGLGKFKDGVTMYIEVKYRNGDKIRYLHLSSINKDIKEGTHVLEGQELGKTGMSGTDHAHLHIDATNSKGERIDPENQNYGTVSNEEFFTTYGGDYKNLRDNKKNQSESGTSPFSSSLRGTPSQQLNDWMDFVDEQRKKTDATKKLLDSLIKATQDLINQNNNPDQKNP